MLVDTLRDWETVLDDLIRSPDKRVQIGQAARVQMRPHSLEAVFRTLERSLLEAQTVARRPSPSRVLRARGGKLIRDARFEAERFARRARRRITRMRNRAD